MSSDALAVSAARLLDPVTGELVELDTVADFAQFRDRLSGLKRTIDAVLVDVDEAITAELDRANTRSGRFGAYDVKVPAPFETVWNLPELGIVLEALVQAGKLTPGAAAAALEAQPITYKARARELAKLLAHVDPDVVEAIDACRHAEPRVRRYATVTRAAPAKRRLEAPTAPQEGTP